MIIPNRVKERRGILNVVRTGSKVSDPSGRILDTGEAMKVKVLTGAKMKAAKIDPGD